MMEGAVNNFLDEVDEIVSAKPTSKNACEWKTCYDEKSGFPYYWNVETNEVRWDLPSELKFSKQNTHATTNKLFPSVSDKEISKEHTCPNQPATDCTDSEERSISRVDVEGENRMENNAKPKSCTEDNHEDFASKSIAKDDTVHVYTSSISLIANYSDSDDDDEEEDVKEVSKSETTPVEEAATAAAAAVAHEEKAENDTDNSPQLDIVDTKPFQRKKRFEIEYSTAIQQTRNEKCGEEEQKSEEVGDRKKGVMLGFERGEVLFAKTDSPTDTPQNASLLDEVEEAQASLREKLAFLNEGREGASPVQIMIIQVETLYEALKSGNLNAKYLHEWLQETCSELIKLEKEATPNGWLLKWDRENKRYYYYNQQSGECQWEYPQRDIVGCDEAMDISTTPPHTANGVEDNSPHSIQLLQGNTTKDEDEMRTVYKEKTSELSETTEDQVSEVPTDGSNDRLGSVLDSFYSDIAALESNPALSDPVADNEVPNTQIVKKRKRTKVKVAEGLSLKKKGVSKLVEKWTSIQKEYD